MRYKIGIVDDEIATCSLIEKIITEYSKARSIQIDCETWVDSDLFIKDMLAGFIPDILFLDIEIPSKSGIEIGNFIREHMNNQMMQIVFVSSKTNYAMELFHIHPYDFLVKPFTNKSVETILDILITITENDHKLYRISYKGEDIFVEWGKIEYLASDNKHIEVYLEDGRTIRFMGKLKDEIEKLPDNFARINQSYVVNLKYVRNYRYTEVTLIDDRKIPVSSPYRLSLKSKLISYLEGENNQ